MMRRRSRKRRRRRRRMTMMMMRRRRRMMILIVNFKVKAKSCTSKEVVIICFFWHVFHFHVEIWMVII
jgi:hypothetical protein